MGDIGTTICGNAALKKLIELSNGVKDIIGDVVEVGVYKGGSALELSKIFQHNDIYLFDTFEGLPKTNEYDNHHKAGDFNDVSYEDVLKLFEHNDKVKVYKGIFPNQNSEVLINKKIKFLHLDVDIYESYVNCLNFFHDKMIKGGIMVFDDYNANTCLGAKKAVDEFIEQHKLELNLGGDGQSYIIY